MLRKIRIVLATLLFVSITLLFLDFTGTLHHYLGWTAKIQLLPAVLSLNVVVVVVLLLVTLLLGRVYCSVVCPLGVMQDVVSRLGKRDRFRFRRPHPVVRWVVLALFVLLLLLGVQSVALLVAPYSAYGRVASQLLQPVFLWANNLLAGWAERHGSYAFHHVDVWLKSGLLLAVAIATLVVVGLCALLWGRAWCNTVCPVGTVLGFVSRFSLFRPRIDADKCVSCGRCERRCKASCIDSKAKSIDHSRCVACMDCIDTCKLGALHYSRGKATPAEAQATAVDGGRRKFLATTAAVVATGAVKAQEMKVDGGLAVIEDKKIPTRATPLKPAGSVGLSHFTKHCTACQLCVAECPNGVLRPSQKFETLLQPEMSYERGYCRPECVRCSQVCPAGAIRRITPADKTAIHIGTAVWIPENCVVNTDGVSCGHCATHCPAEAILMVALSPDKPDGLRVPTVDESRCIGCGACENLCPARPFSAIYVEGRTVHAES